jgi:hypothetical protein
VPTAPTADPHVHRFGDNGATAESDGRIAQEPSVAKNGERGSQSAAVSSQPQAKNPAAGLWTKRNTSSGRFSEVKRSGNVVKGVRKEN